MTKKQGREERVYLASVPELTQFFMLGKARQQSVRLTWESEAERAHFNHTQEGQRIRGD